MGTLHTITSSDENSTEYVPAKSILGKLPEVNIPEGSEDKFNLVDTESLNIPSIDIPKHAIATPLKNLEGHFRLLQMWEGRVIFVDNEKHEFSAIITDKTYPENAEEQVVLSIEEISQDDRSLLREGAVFYWSIGYADYPGRPRTRESRIRFRRLPHWSSKELNRAKKIGARLAELFSTDR